MKRTSLLPTVGYEEALEALLETDASYANGLSNHGPMAIEALEHLAMPHWIGPFIEHYRVRLEAGDVHREPAPLDWRSWLGEALPSLVSKASNLAGHGLLRTAHAVRAAERAETTGSISLVHRKELAAAVRYWSDGGPGVPGPAALTGALTPAAWLETLDRLPADQRSEGLLTATFATVAKGARFHELVAALAPAGDPTVNLDALGHAAALAFARNRGTSAFALLHGTTVSSMATVLLPHLDEQSSLHLEAAIATFVAAAVIGFDTPEGAIDSVDDEIRSVAELAEAAGASKEDHTIKFVDACIDIAQRSGDRSILRAAHRQIIDPYGLE